MNEHLSKYFIDPSSFTTTLLTILLDQYGTECLTWDPLTLAMEIKHDFSVNIPASINDKIQAGAALLSTNLFFQSVETFIASCNVMAGEAMATGMFIPADVDACVWGVTEAKMLLGTDYDAKSFTSNIQLYVGFTLASEGIMTPPSSLKFAAYPSQADTSTGEETNDEEFYRATWTMQEERTNEIELRTREKIKELLQQLKDLPVKGLDKDFLDRALKQLEEADDTP